MDKHKPRPRQTLKALQWLCALFTYLVVMAPANAAEPKCPDGSWKHINIDIPSQTGCFKCYSGLEKAKNGSWMCEDTLYSKGELLKGVEPILMICPKGFIGALSQKCYSCPDLPKTVWKEGKKGGVILYGTTRKEWTQHVERPPDDPKVCSIQVVGQPIPVASKDAVRAACEKAVVESFGNPRSSMNAAQQVLFPPALVNELNSRTATLRQSLEAQAKAKSNFNSFITNAAIRSANGEVNRLMIELKGRQQQFKNLFSPKTICDGETWGKLLGDASLVPNLAYRGKNSFWAFSQSIGVTVGTAGMTLTQSVVTNFHGENAVMVSLSPGLSSDFFGGSIGMSVQYYPQAGKLENFEGLGMELGLNANLPAELASIGTSSQLTLQGAPQGIGGSLSMGVGANPFPVGGSFSVGYTRILAPLELRDAISANKAALAGAR